MSSSDLLVTIPPAEPPPHDRLGRTLAALAGVAPLGQLGGRAARVATARGAAFTSAHRVGRFGTHDGAGVRRVPVAADGSVKTQGRRGRDRSAASRSTRLVESAARQPRGAVPARPRHTRPVRVRWPRGTGAGTVAPGVPGWRDDARLPAAPMRCAAARGRPPRLPPEPWRGHPLAMRSHGERLTAAARGRSSATAPPGRPTRTGSPRGKPASRSFHD